jgi:calcineurin-like phosphoesterase family protein
MDNQLIENWNEKIKPNDIVWHLGNFAWDVIAGESALQRLNGQINLIQSETDMSMNDMFNVQGVNKFQGYFISEGHNCVMSHWPLVDWPAKRTKQSLHLHGSDKEYRSQLQIEKRFNVNCELWSLGPVSLESLNDIKNMVE